MSTISILLFGLFVGIISYIIGARSGMKTFENEYDRGYEDGYKDADKAQSDYYEVFNEGRDAAIDFIRENYHLVLKDEAKKDNLQELCNQLEELFEGDDEDNDNGIDCGTY